MPIDIEEWVRTATQEQKHGLAGTLASVTGEPIAALMHFSWAIERGNENARVERALLLCELGHMDLARIDWKRVREHCPEMPTFEEARRIVLEAERSEPAKVRKKRRRKR